MWGLNFCHQDYSDDDISWLTQEPSQSNEETYSGLNLDYIESEIPLGIDGSIVSLEENGTGRKILYDNVIVENISSYECVDKM